MRGGGVLVLGLCVGCFAPTPQPGAPCTNGACPTGLVCASATLTCELREPVADAAPTADDAPADTPDGALLIPPDAPPDAQQCFGAGLALICLDALPTAPLSITANTTIDTSSQTECVGYSGPLEGQLCVVAATSVSIADQRRLRGIGARPLVVVSTSTIVVDGTIDVSSGGAGANPSPCIAPAAATSRQGGAGGSFRGRGGSGGGTESGLGPASGAATTTAVLRGGCRGGSGAGSGAGSGGSGGGAVYLIASSITVNGTLDASGDAGRGATASGGGGGGGAGGFIGLDAPMVVVASSGRVFANGGGGGEGGTPNHDGNGGSMSNGPTSAGSGGSGGANHGGNGGAGSSGTSLTGNNGGSGGNCGRDGESGGGGGGGAGFVYVFPTQTLGGSVAPPP